MSCSIPRPILRACTVLQLAGLIACGELPPYYEGTLAEWRRDSATVDSLSRMIDTDSVYHAYHASLRSDNLQGAHQTITCARMRLFARHGPYPAVLALERMQDTLWNGVDPQLVQAHDARAPDFMTVRVDNTSCGIPDAADTLPTIVRSVDPRNRPWDLK